MIDERGDQRAQTPDMERMARQCPRRRRPARNPAEEDPRRAPPSSSLRLDSSSGDCRTAARRRRHSRPDRHRPRERRGGSTMPPAAAVLAALLLLLVPSASRAFHFLPPPLLLPFVTSARTGVASRHRHRLVRVSAAAGKDDVAMNLERARAVLEKARQKLASQSRDDPGRRTATMVAERDRLEPQDVGLIAALESSPSPSSSSSSSSPPLPFFASREAASPPSSPADKRQRVIKSIDEATGLITTDGEKMARLSEEEDWEARSLFEVFENEIADKDAYSVTSKQLATRDVAASIWNLRKTLQSEDYKKIFDEKNRFIGEGN